MCSARLAPFKQWKDSAGIILIAKTVSDNCHIQNYTYKVLTLKRSSQSSVWPNFNVFPGGKVNTSDSSNLWLQLYERFGYTKDAFSKLIPKLNSFDELNKAEIKALPLIVAHRITAIRETFEECGILICRNETMQHFLTKRNQWTNCFICSDEIKKWQSNIINDPSQFYELCEKFNFYPDIWSLNKWSNWATPACLKNKFNSTFFLAAVEEMPSTSIDNKEIQDLRWATPLEYVIKNNNAEINLHLPQLYDISRLQTFLDVNDLLSFVKENQKNDIAQFLPYTIQTDEGKYTILPGDDLYPDEHQLLEQNLHYIKSLPETKVQHRLLECENETKIIIQNYTPPNNYTPISNKL